MSLPQADIDRIVREVMTQLTRLRAGRCLCACGAG